MANRNDEVRNAPSGETVPESTTGAVKATNVPPIDVDAGDTNTTSTPSGKTGSVRGGVGENPVSFGGDIGNTSKTGGLTDRSATGIGSSSPPMSGNAGNVSAGDTLDPEPGTYGGQMTRHQDLDPSAGSEDDFGSEQTANVG
jgi:hypothetical protein